LDDFDTAHYMVKGKVVAVKNKNITVIYPLIDGATTYVVDLYYMHCNAQDTILAGQTAITANFLLKYPEILVASTRAKHIAKLRKLSDDATIMDV